MRLWKLPQLLVFAFNRDEAKLTVLGVPDIPGVAYRILGPIGEANIEVDVILQNIGEDGKTDFTFTVGRGDLARSQDILSQTVTELGALELRVDSKLPRYRLSVWECGLTQAWHRLCLGLWPKSGVNIQMISTSEIKISVINRREVLELAVRTLHSAFALDAEPEEQPTAV